MSDWRDDKALELVQRPGGVTKYVLSVATGAKGVTLDKVCSTLAAVKQVTRSEW